MGCRCLWHLLASLPEDVRQGARRIAIDGTSATALLLDARNGDLLTDAKLYNEAQPAEAVAKAAVCSHLLTTVLRPAQHQFLIIGMSDGPKVTGQTPANGHRVRKYIQLPPTPRPSANCSPGHSTIRSRLHSAAEQL
jgi:hypothetical protein